MAGRQIIWTNTRHFGEEAATHYVAERVYLRRSNTNLTELYRQQQSSDQGERIKSTLAAIDHNLRPRDHQFSTLWGPQPCQPNKRQPAMPKRVYLGRVARGEDGKYFIRRPKACAMEKRERVDQECERRVRVCVRVASGRPRVVCGGRAWGRRRGALPGCGEGVHAQLWPRPLRQCRFAVAPRPPCWHHSSRSSPLLAAPLGLRLLKSPWISFAKSVARAFAGMNCTHDEVWVSRLHLWPARRRLEMILHLLASFIPSSAVTKVGH